MKVEKFTKSSDDWWLKKYTEDLAFHLIQL